MVHTKYHSLLTFIILLFTIIRFGYYFNMSKIILKILILCEKKILIYHLVNILNCVLCDK